MNIRNPRVQSELRDFGTAKRAGSDKSDTPVRQKAAKTCVVRTKSRKSEFYLKFLKNCVKCT